MKKIILLSIISTSFITSLWSQVTLDANGAGNTYGLINSVFAPSGSNPNTNAYAIEAPDNCAVYSPAHPAFGNPISGESGRHIEEVPDAELGIDVFKFFIHLTPDNDKCANSDRQRNEIKTYESSPANLKAVEGENVIYKWKFKLPAGFQPTTQFTHIHQIKSVGGAHEDTPMITFTLRRGSSAANDNFEVRHAAFSSQSTIKTAKLDLFRGHWVDVTETIHYNTNATLGTYSLEIRKVSDNSLILKYPGTTDPTNIATYQDGATFARPKWGIYRSTNATALATPGFKDEEVLFANFSIQEVPSLSVNDFDSKADNIVLVPNPSNDKVTFKNAEVNNYDTVLLYDSIGKQIPIVNRLSNNTLNVSGLTSGLYFIVFKKDNLNKKILKCMVK